MSKLLKSASQTTILIIDDNPDNIRFLAKILEAHGYIVRKALSGKIVLQSVQREPPDLILLDINMPDLNGYEVCLHLRTLAATKNTPIIFISALDNINNKVLAFELGGQDYIAKPFHELEVLARIKNQLLIQQQQQQLIEQNQKLEQEIQHRQLAEAEIQRLNLELEQQIKLRTLELQQSLNFEATLKRISDKVRDSLDQNQILQVAVEELALALELKCCDANLYTHDHQSTIIRYQYVASGEPLTQGQMLYMTDTPEIYHQLQQHKSYLSFCQIKPIPIRNHSATLACPIFDDQVAETGILGDLWLFKDTHSTFTEMEIHLVQQVANQCAVALRQAHLYQAAQAQVKELQRLNQLKDDFLCTISHELRTPVASMKIGIELLKTLSQQTDELTKEVRSHGQNRQAIECLNVLQQQCDRELELIEDLLSLQYLEAGTYPQQLTQINLHDWILHIIEQFQILIQNQQQILEINLAPDLPTLNLDAFSLSRILTELLNNAHKYTPAGEKITLAASVIQDNTATPEPQPILQIIVNNTGVEIPSEEIPRIFDKFYRIPNHDPWKYSGTGLGLALVKKLVAQINGTIIAESSNNQTQFLVQFPIL
ncbi:response regulator [Nostoc linckia FACHB-104]|nr:response regulator [Nostoc linckia FACHB-104]